MTENSETLGLATILKDLEETISSASRVPLSGKVMVDGDAILEYVDKIYTALPEELKQAQRVLEHSDKLLETVEGQSKRIIAEAREEAERMTTETEIYQAATKRAEAMLAQSEKASAELRHESLLYCDDVLSQLEENLGKMANSIRKNREDLRSFKYFSMDEQEEKPEE